MSDTAKIVALFAGLLAGLLAWSAWSGAGKDPEQSTAWAGAKIDWGKPAAHGCSQDWMAAVLPVDHPVYRQWQPGAARQGLITNGWSWISDPPSEQGLGNE